MKASDCIRNALKVWKDAGIYDVSDMRPHVERLEKIAKNKELSEAQRLRMARQEHKESVKKQFQAVVGTEVSREKLESLINAMDAILKSGPDGPEKARVALNGVVEYGIANARQQRPDGIFSLAGLANAYRTEIMGKLRPYYDKYVNRLTIASKEEAKLLRLAMEGGDPKDAQIAKDAADIKAILAPYLQHARDNGVYIAELEFWSPGRPQEGIVRTHLAEFKQFLRENLNQEIHPNVEESVDRIANSILDPIPERDNILSLSREVYLKTPAARVEYMTRFGQGDLMEALQGYVGQLSNTTAQAKMLGPDAHRTMKLLADDVARKIVKADPTSTFKPDTIMIAFEDATNRVMDPLNQREASVAASTRNFASGSFLGAVGLAAVSTDALFAPLRLSRSLGWGRGFSETAIAYGKMLGPEGRQYVREQLGIMEHVIHLLGPDARFVLDSPISKVENVSRKYSIQMMRLSSTEAIEQVQRGVASIALSRAMARDLGDLTWDQLGKVDPKFRQMLENNAIGQGSWSKLSKLRDSIVDPEHGWLIVDNIQDTDLRMSVRSYLVRETQSMVLRPDVTTRQFLRGGGARRGTVGYEVSAFASQFLSWPIQMARAVLARQISMGVPGAIAASTAVYAMSIVTEQLYAVARGQPGYALDNENLYYRALIRSGLLTPVGEFAVGSAMGDWRASPSLGPVLDTVGRLFRATGKIGQAAYEQDTYAALSEVTKTVKVLLPNTWYLEAMIIKPAHDAIMWEVDPKFMRQYERRMKEERQ